MLQDLQATIDVLDQMLDARDLSVPTPAWREAADTYQDECRKANARLLRCRQMLQKGLKADALHDAEQEPNLFQVAAMLEFPRRANVVTTLEMLKLSVPPPLPLDVLQALEEAAEQVRPLETLLRQLRRQVLEQAELGDRLVTLRRLEKADPVTAFWDQDIRALEKAWIKKCADVLKPFAEEGRTAEIQKHLDEFAGGKFREEVPPFLTSRLRELRGKAAGIEAGSVAQQLQDAFVEQDADRAAGLHRRLRELQKIAGLPDTDRSLRWAAQAIEWVEEAQLRESRAQAVAAAERQMAALLGRQGLTSAMLAAAIDHAMVHYPDLSVDLARRAVQQLNDLRTAESRLRTAVAAGAVAMAVLLAAGAVWWGIEYRRSTAVEALKTKVDTAMKARNYAEAREAFDAAPSAVRGDARVAGLGAEIDEGATKESARLARFNAALEALALEAGDPEASEAYNTARNSAETPEEREALKGRVESSRRRRAADKERRKAGERASLDKLKTDAERFEAEAVHAGEGGFREDALRKAIAAADALLAAQRTDSSELAPETEGMLKRLRAVGATVELRRGEVRIRGRMVDCAADAEGFAKYLEALGELAAKGAPEERPAREKLLADREAWTKAAAAAREQLGWCDAPFPGPRGTDGRVAELDRIEAADESRKEAVDRYRRTLKAAAKADLDEERAPGRQMERLLKDEFWSKARLVVAVGGQRYYTTEQAVATVVGGKRKTTFVHRTGLRSENTARVPLLDDDIVSNELAPHAEWAVKAKPPFTDTRKSWEDRVAGLLVSLAERKDIDPLLAAIMARAVLRTGAAGNPAIDDATPELEELRKFPTDAAWWANDRPLTKERDDAARLVAAAGKLSDLSARTAAVGRSMALRATGVLAPFGWLDGGDPWKLVAFHSPPPQVAVAADLFVLRAGAEGRPTEIQVGAVRGGKATLKQPTIPSGSVGRVVFARPVEAAAPP